MGQQTSHETCFSTEDVDGEKYWVEFDQNYFAMGGCRYAFKGTLHGDGSRNNKACVAKVFQESIARRYSVMVPDLAACKKIVKFVEQFNGTGVSTATINVVLPLIAKMQNVAGFKLFWLFKMWEDTTYVKAYEYISIEPYLDGTFEKYNSNCGYENKSDPLMTAFSHWTWCTSGHRFMACDIQGVRKGNTYTLTDPAIHSVDRLYGDTDLGVLGMEKVLAKHTCNAICKKLDLYNPLNGVSVPTRGRHTSFVFEITEEDQLRKMKGKKSQHFVLSPIAELH